MGRSAVGGEQQRTTDGSTASGGDGHFGVGHLTLARLTAQL
jgi:hypothetical protein